MSNNKSIGIEKRTRTWTSERTKSAGIAGIVGGIGLAATAIIYNALGIEPGTLAGTASGAIHAVAYALMLATLLGIHARYSGSYGRLGRGVVLILGTALAALSVGFILLTFVFGMNWMPGAIVVGIGFLLIHLLGVVYGVVLWRNTTLHLAAGLLMLVVPAIPIIIGFEQIGISLTAAAIEVPLYLGFAALGYDLWSDSTSTAPDVTVPDSAN